MIIGIGSDHDSEIITAAKWLDHLPDWSVIRNACDTNDGDGFGAHWIKVQLGHGHWEWQIYDPYSEKYKPINAGPITSADVFLPVQVIRRGPK